MTDLILLPFHWELGPKGAETMTAGDAHKLLAF